MRSHAYQVDVLTLRMPHASAGRVEPKNPFIYKGPVFAVSQGKSKRHAIARGMWNAKRKPNKRTEGRQDVTARKSMWRRALVHVDTSDRCFDRSL